MKCVPIVLAIALFGCKHADRPIVQPPGLEIVSPGAEPKRLLRYAIAKGTKTPFELAVEDVLPDGTMKIRTTVVEVTARDRAESHVTAAALAAQTDQLKGLAI